MSLLSNFKASTIYEEMYKRLWEEKRILYLNTEIDESTIDLIALPILLMNELEEDIPVQKLKPITIWISSYGGSADACAYLVDVIEKSRIPIHGRVLSVAASAGLYLLLACKYRTANTNSILLLHKGSISLGNTNVAEAEDIIAFYKDDVGKIFDDLILRRTKITPDELKMIRRNETYCLAPVALELYGFIDEII